MYKQIFELMSIRRFLPLFLTQFLTAFNDNIFRIALVSMVTFHDVGLSDTAKTVIIIMAIGVFQLPYFLFSATAGQIADKYNKAKIIQYVRLVEIFIMGLGVIGFITVSPFFLLFVLFMMGTNSTFFGPVKYSIMPDHLKEEELITANGLIEGGTFIGILLGVFVGGMLMSAENINVNNTILCTMAVAIISYITSLFIPPTKDPDSDITISRNPLKITFNLIEYTKKENYPTFLAILAISWFWLIGTIYLSNLSILVSDVFHTEIYVYTFLMTIFTLGVSFGSLFCNYLLKGEISAKYVPITSLIMSFVIFDFYICSSMAHSVYVETLSASEFIYSFTGFRTIIDMFAISFFGSIYVVPLYSLVQIKTEKKFTSRVIAVNNIINSFFMVIATGISFILTNLLGFSFPQLFLVLAIANFIVAINICKVLPETVLRAFFAMMFKLIYRVEIKGLENFEKLDSKVVLISNHTSFLDAALIATFIPLKIKFAINKEVSTKWWVKPFLSIIDVYPIDKTSPMAVRSLIDELEKNNVIAIFPEGRITTTGSLMKIYEGPGLIASKTNADILPIKIEGALFTHFSHVSKLFGLVRLFPKVTISVAEPRKIGIPKSTQPREIRMKSTINLYDIMCNTMFEGSNNEKTILTSLLDARKMYGGRRIILDDVERKPISYNKLLLGAHLISKKIKPIIGDAQNIGILLPNVKATASSYFAVHLLDKVPTMLNFSNGVNNILDNCKTAKVKYIITSEKFLSSANLGKLLDKRNNLQLILLEDIKRDIGSFEKTMTFIFQSSIFNKIYENSLKNKDFDRPATIIFTSGSEGKPKGVVLSHKNILSNIAQLSSKIDFGINDRVFNVLPLFHSFGLTAVFLLPLLHGVKIFLYPTPLHNKIIPELIYETDSTFLFGTDTFLNNYAKYAHPFDFHRLRYVFSGAEKLREETREIWLNKFGIRILEGYGASECSPGISVNTPMHFKKNSVGRFLPGIEYRIEPVEGVKEGGKLMLKGPNIMLGYMKYDKPGIIQPPKDNEYDTGDIVTIDDEGFVAIVGRLKRFAKIGGEMVSLAAVESYVNEIYNENLSVAINLPDSKKGEQVIIATDCKDANKSEIIKYFRENNLPEIYIPKSIIHKDEIPVLGTGKVNLVAIKNQVEQEFKIDHPEKEDA